MSLMQGIRLYPKAVLWSVLISTCIAMEELVELTAAETSYEPSANSSPYLRLNCGKA
jgi:hypothetical protein